MSKNKNKNQYGTFLTGKSGFKKYARFSIAAIVAVIFVLGAGYLGYNKLKPVKKAVVAVQPEGPIPGWWLQQYFGSSVCDKDICMPDADPDKDSLNNQQEFYYHTNPLVAFTVNDTLNDGQLVAKGFDPSRPGRMTFDQVTSTDNILGESLLVQQDFQDIINQSKDISKIQPPLVAESDLRITDTQDADTYKKYSTDLQIVINKYFPQDSSTDFSTILQSAEGSSIEDINTKSSLLSEELRGITVPRRLLNYHQYVMAFFQLMPKVLVDKNDSTLSVSNPANDAWYENAQALFVVSQKLNLEQARLSSLTGIK